VESSYEKGSTFTVALPIDTEEVFLQDVTAMADLPQDD
jgi:hypothetical protein